jgi:hypothetical protein
MQAYTNPEATANFRNGMASGISLQPPLDANLLNFVRSRGINLMVDPVVRTNRDFTPTALAAQQKTLNELTGIGKIVWNIMPEWDQSGGTWVPNGRPRYTNLTREQAYNRFFSYYATNYASVKTVFDQPPASRNYWLASITDHAPNSFYAYEMGADICLLERSIDELGDLSTGIAFVRGAARQYDRQWGIDISTFRTANNSATRFDDRETLLGGWSTSYLRRHYYLSYMSGAHILRNEATAYYNRLNQLDPVGRITREFSDFVFNRHFDVGRPTVDTALLVNHYSGFDPKHWIYNQDNAVWYQDIPYSEGDRMINNFLKLAYPNHWLHGQTPGAPFSDARGFQSFLASGGDARPFEPMSTTRYGDGLDVLTDRASLDALRNYKVILLLGDVPVDARLRDALISWVQEGGTLVTTVHHRSAFDESFLGVRIDDRHRKATSGIWLADGTTYREPPYSYYPVAVTTASVLATTETSAPLLTANAVGKGRVIFSSAPYLQNVVQDQILFTGARLFDWLTAQNAVASLEGPPAEFIVNQASGRVIVTVVNNSGQDWNGTVVVANQGNVVAVREYIADQDVRWARSLDKIRLTALVPAYDVKVFAVESRP